MFVDFCSFSSTALNMPFVPVETPKCPVCNKSVYAAEERVANGHKYHKGCFKCGKLTDIPFHQKNWRSIWKLVLDSTKFLFWIMTSLSPFAGMCNKFLESTNCNEHNKELYCKNCYGRKYGPKGYGFGGGAGALCMDDGEHLKSQ